MNAPAPHPPPYAHARRLVDLSDLTRESVDAVAAPWLDAVADPDLAADYAAAVAFHRTEWPDGLPGCACHACAAVRDTFDVHAPHGPNVCAWLNPDVLDDMPDVAAVVEALAAVWTARTSSSTGRRLHYAAAVEAVADVLPRGWTFRAVEAHSEAWWWPCHWERVSAHYPAHEWAGGTCTRCGTDFEAPLLGWLERRPAQRAPRPVEARA